MFGGAPQLQVLAVEEKALFRGEFDGAEPEGQACLIQTDAVPQEAGPAGVEIGVFAPVPAVGPGDLEAGLGGRGGAGHAGTGLSLVQYLILDLDALRRARNAGADLYLPVGAGLHRQAGSAVIEQVKVGGPGLDQVDRAVDAAVIVEVTAQGNVVPMGVVGQNQQLVAARPGTGEGKAETGIAALVAAEIAAVQPGVADAGHRAEIHKRRPGGVRQGQGAAVEPGPFLFGIVPVPHMGQGDVHPVLAGGKGLVGAVPGAAAELPALPQQSNSAHKNLLGSVKISACRKTCRHCRNVKEISAAGKRCKRRSHTGLLHPGPCRSGC